MYSNNRDEREAEESSVGRGPPWKSAAELAGEVKCLTEKCDSLNRELWARRGEHAQEVNDLRKSHDKLSAQNRQLRLDLESALIREHHAKSQLAVGQLRLDLESALIREHPAKSQLAVGQQQRSYGVSLDMHERSVREWKCKAEGMAAQCAALVESRQAQATELASAKVEAGEWLRIAEAATAERDQAAEAWSQAEAAASALSRGIEAAHDEAAAARTKARVRLRANLLLTGLLVLQSVGVVGLYALLRLGAL